MNKKITTLLITAAMLATSSAVFAATPAPAETTAPTATAEASATPAATADPEASATPAATADPNASAEPSIEIDGTVIAEENEYDAKIVSVDEESLTVNIEDAEYYFMYNDDTAVYTITGEKKAIDDLKEDTEIKLFSTSLLLTKDIKFADAIVITDPADAASSVDVDTYLTGGIFGDYTNAKEDLALNISDDTEIVDMDGNKVDKDDLNGKKLMVFYSIVTMSLPAQTNPTKIVVLPSEEVAPTSTPAATTAPTATPVATTDPASITAVTAGSYSGTTTYDADTQTYELPVRAVSEALGFVVTWDGDSVTVGVDNVKFQIGSVTCTEGDESYTKKKAAVLKNDTTYVSSDFFSDVLKLNVSIENNALVISK